MYVEYFTYLCIVNISILVNILGGSMALSENTILGN